jgi:xanthine dehydrogenase YagR molybdenum-binding subunit
MGEPLRQKVGDAEAALAAAPHRVDVAYTTPRHHHAPIELHARMLAWEGDTLRIHDASQAMAHEAWTIAQVLGPKDDQARRTSPFGGGGFGSKLLWQHQILAAATAKIAPTGPDHSLPRWCVPYRWRPHRH